MSISKFNIRFATALFFFLKANGTLLGADSSPLTSPKDTPAEVEVEVPASLHDNGYQLNLDGEQIDLKGNKTKLKPTLDPVRVELFSRRGDLLWDGRHYVDAGLFEDLYARRFSVDFYLASVQPSSRQQWARLLLSGERTQFGADLNWLSENGFGPFVSVNFQSAGKRMSEGAMALYSSASLGTGVFYNWAPWIRSQRYWRKVNIQGELGLLGNNRSVTWADDQDSYVDRSNDLSFMTGAAMKFPMGGNFSLKGRYRFATEDANFRRFHVHIRQGAHFLQFSGSYAF